MCHICAQTNLVVYLTEAISADVYCFVQVAVRCCKPNPGFSCDSPSMAQPPHDPATAGRNNGAFDIESLQELARKAHNAKKKGL